jgi:hypothetical protein
LFDVLIDLIDPDFASSKRCKKTFKLQSPRSSFQQSTTITPIFDWQTSGFSEQHHLFRASSPLVTAEIPLFYHTALRESPYKCLLACDTFTLEHYGYL